LDPKSLSKFHLSILHTESSEGWGGQEIRILLESLGMIKRGHRVVIAASPRSHISAQAPKHGVEVVRFFFQKKNPLSFWKMASLIDREKIEIVNTHSSSDSWIASLAARLSRRKPQIIRTRHLSTPISKSVWSRLIYNKLPAAIITTGEEIRRRMIQDNGFDPAKIFSMPTGIDLDRFDPEKITPAFQKKGFTVGMIGVLRSWKGHQFFIQAVPLILKALPQTLFYIIGDGPRLQHIKALIQNLALENRIFMLGHREDIPELLSSLDVLVHPSTANEGVPQAILQALAMRKPVIASDVGAIREVIIHGQTGILIPPQETQDIADRVVDLFKNPVLRERLGNEGQRMVRDSYSLERMLDRIEELYARLRPDLHSV
jgi:glycosyltransferase involved in cell wall biosynthesis